MPTPPNSFLTYRTCKHSFKCSPNYQFKWKSINIINNQGWLHCLISHFNTLFNICIQLNNRRWQLIKIHIKARTQTFPSQSHYLVSDQNHYHTITSHLANFGLFLIIIISTCGNIVRLST